MVDPFAWGLGCEQCGCSECSIAWTICAKDGCNSNAALAGATITVKDSEGSTVASCVTSGDGCCTFSLPASGTYTAQIGKTGYKTATLALEAECGEEYSNSVSLITTAAATERCWTVRNCAGNLLQGATVAITGGGGASGTTGADGKFCWTPTQAGPISTTITAPCHLPYTDDSESPCAFTGGSVTLEIDDDSVCCGTCVMPKTLYLTDSGGTVSSEYGSGASYGADWLFCGTSPVTDRVVVYDPLDGPSTEEDCTPVAGVGCTSGHYTAPKPSSSEALPCFYLLSCSGTTPTLQVISVGGVSTYCLPTGTNCCPKGGGEAYIEVPDFCLEITDLCTDPSAGSCTGTDWTYNSVSGSCQCDVSLVFEYTGGRWTSTICEGLDGEPPSPTVTITS